MASRPIGRLVRVAAGCGAAALAIVPALAAPVGAAPSPVGAPSATCEGETATILGSPGRPTLRGTSGRDVVLTRGSTRVVAGGGDDLVCVTGRAARVEVLAGDGNDRVVVSSRGTTAAVLGAGNDSYTGGAGADLVDRGGSPGADQIETGAGPDLVQTGEAGTANRDVVDLGAGRDQVVVLGSDNGSAVLEGGEGLDRFSASYGTGPTPSADVAFDNTTGTATLGGDVVARWQGLERFDVATFSTGAVEFTGGDGAEQVWATGGNPLTVDLGDGDDRLRIDDVSVVEALEGGEGTDLLAAWGGDDDPLAGNLSDQRIAFGDDLDPADLASLDDAVAFAGFEALELVAPAVVALGGDGADILRVGGCDARADGGDGPDRVLRLPARHLDGGCDGYRTRLRGGSGADELVGGSGDDALLGGPGRDLGIGRDGSDRCRTEIARTCES